MNNNVTKVWPTAFTVMSIMQQELDPNKSIEAHPYILHFREKANFFFRWDYMSKMLRSVAAIT